MADQNNDFVEVSTLKDYGFTDEELAGVVTPDPTPDSTPDPDPTPDPVDPTPTPDPDPTPDPVDYSQVDGDTVDKKHPNVVAYDRFKEVNDRMKAMKAELDALKQSPAPQPQQPVYQQPSAPVPPVDLAEKIAEIAEHDVRRRLGIIGEIEDLQIQDPKKYAQFIKEVAKTEIKLENKINEDVRIQYENDSFIKELGSRTDAQVLVSFAEQELDELPAKEARPIERARERLLQKQATSDDLAILRKFVGDCQEKLNAINNPAPAPTPGAISTPSTPPATSPLDKAAGLPRSQSLSGAKTSAMSWAQVEQLIREGRINEIPKDMIAQIDPRLLE